MILRTIVNFTTPVKLQKAKFPLRLGLETLALGSCFAGRIGGKLQRSLFPTTVNPTGLHYNPVSLAQDLKVCKEPVELFLHEGLWRSLRHHSQLSERRVSEARALVQQAERCQAKALKDSELLLLTLGTGQVFEQISSRRIVSNCHRLPQTLFRRRNLTLEEVLLALASPLHTWLEESKERRVILTVSPIRYLRGGLVENSRAKAVLVLACAELEKLHPRLDYFPSYEIVIDELRSYRFFEEDMIRPNNQALRYIWDAFCRTYFCERELLALKKIEKIQTLAEHRLSPNSKPQEVGRKGMAWLEELTSQYTQLKTGELERYFQKLLGASS